MPSSTPRLTSLPFSRSIVRWTLLVGLLALLLPFLSGYQPSSNSFIATLTPPVLLLVAHPDDEVMFFAPTILALRERAMNLTVASLSNGDADGLGKTRQSEFLASLNVLGVGRGSGHIFDHPDLKDNFTTVWSPTTIASLIEPLAIKERIQTILTFDSYGVSGHPNHGSLSHGAATLVGSFSAQGTKIRLWTLISRNRLLKFTGPVTMPFQFTNHTVTVDRKGYITALQAMRAHRSQLVWFRYLYLGFSRYMYVNEWKEMT